MSNEGSVMLISDGTPRGTKLIVNGVLVPLIQKIEWKVEVDGLATAVVTLLKVPVELQLSLDQVKLVESRSENPPDISQPDATTNRDDRT